MSLLLILTTDHIPGSFINVHAWYTVPLRLWLSLIPNICQSIWWWVHSAKVKSVCLVEEDEKLGCLFQDTNMLYLLCQSPNAHVITELLWMMASSFPLWQVKAYKCTSFLDQRRLHSNQVLTRVHFVVCTNRECKQTFTSLSECGHLTHYVTTFYQAILHACCSWWRCLQSQFTNEFEHIESELRMSLVLYWPYSLFNLKGNFGFYNFCWMKHWRPILAFNVTI